MNIFVIEEGEEEGVKFEVAKRMVVSFDREAIEELSWLGRSHREKEYYAKVELCWMIRAAMKRRRAAIERGSLGEDRGRLRATIVEYLQENGVSEGAAIERALKIKKGNFRQCMRLAVRAGVVVRKYRGVYCLPEGAAAGIGQEGVSDGEV